MQEPTKIIAFMMEGQLYGIDIQFVQSIENTPEDITELPQSDFFVKGITYFRGKVLSVLKLKELLHISKDETKEDQLIVLEMKGNEIGLMVDKAIDIREVKPDDIEEIPSIINSDKVHLKGVIHWGEELLTLLDVEPLFHTE